MTPGDNVQFQHRGRVYVGTVTEVTDKRGRNCASVVVAHAHYPDDQRLDFCMRWLVPLEDLRRVAWEEP